MVRSRITSYLVAALCIAVVSGVDAGERRHPQSVCDEAELIGAAYGACNVYCEALDCDGADPDMQSRACERAYDRFVDLTGNVPPCEPLCPCASGWHSPEFIPAEIELAECFTGIRNDGQYVDLRFEGAPDESGEPSLSAAGTEILDDDAGAIHAVRCYAERIEGGNHFPTNDSGIFEMLSNFADEGEQFDQLQNRLYRSCSEVLQRIILETGTECEVFDFRGE